MGNLNVYANSAGTLQLDGNGSPNSLPAAIAGTIAFYCNATAPATLAFEPSASQVLADGITGNAALWLENTTATLDLGGSNTYAGGTQIVAGMLQFSASATVPTTGQITIDSGGTLEASGPYPTAAAWLTAKQTDAIAIINPTFAGTLAIGATADDSHIVLTGYSSLWIGAATSNSTFGGSITPASTAYMLGGGSGTLIVQTILAGNYAVDISGNVVLPGVNTYAGTTEVMSGTLTVIGGDTGLPAGAGLTARISCSSKDLEHVFIVPTTCGAIHGHAVVVGMLLQQRQCEAIQPGEILTKTLITDA